MSSTAAALLVEVEAAISAVLKGQSISYRDKSVTRANLSELLSFRTQLRAEVARGNGGIKVHGVEINYHG